MLTLNVGIEKVRERLNSNRLERKRGDEILRWFRGVKERDFDRLERERKKTYDRLERKTNKGWNSDRLNRAKQCERNLRWCE